MEASLIRYSTIKSNISFASSNFMGKKSIDKGSFYMRENLIKSHKEYYDTILQQACLNNDKK